MLIASEVRSGEVWRVVTWPLANGPSVWVAIGIAIFWYFGSQVEAPVGPRPATCWLLVLITVVPGLVAT